jgi:hypothetical protein
MAHLVAARPETRLGPHLWLAAACLLVLVAVVAVTRITTRRRVQQAVDPALPAPPRPMPVPMIEPMAGVALGTTGPGGWRDSGISGALGSRESGDLLVTCVGVDLPGLWIPSAALRDVRVDERFATKFMPGPGLLVFSWEAGGRAYESGFRGKASRYEEVVAAVQGLLTEELRTA